MLPLARKYYAPEPKPAPAPNPRLEASRKILEESRRRFSRAQGSELRKLDQPERLDHLLATGVTRDDEIDVWHRQGTLNAQPSISEFSDVSSDGYDCEHPVPCGDRLCDHCYVLSVVSEFDEDDAVDLDPPVQPVRSTLDATTSTSLNWLQISEKTQEVQKPSKSSNKPACPVVGEMPDDQCLRLHMDAHEPCHDFHQMEPSNGSRIEATQDALAEYMRFYTKAKQRCDPNSLLQAQMAGSSRPQLGCVLSTKHSSVEKGVRSPLDRLQDKLTCVSVAAEAQGREPSPALMTLFTPSSADVTYSCGGYVRSSEGFWAAEIERLIRRTSESSSHPAIVSDTVISPAEHEPRPLAPGQGAKYTVPCQPLQRSLSFRERIGRMSSSSGRLTQCPRQAGDLSLVGIPRIGKGSKPPLSRSSFGITR